MVGDDKTRRANGGEWCPYCGRYAVVLGKTELRCEACGRVAELTPREYARIKADYGPGGTHRRKDEAA